MPDRCDRITLRVFVPGDVTYTDECLRHLADQQSIALSAPTPGGPALGRARIVKATRSIAPSPADFLVAVRTLDLTLDVLPNPNDDTALDAALATATMRDGRYPVSMLFESVREMLPARGRVFDRIRVHALVILAGPAVPEGS